MSLYAQLDGLWRRLAKPSTASLLHDARRRLLTFTASLTIVIATIWVLLTASSVVEGRPFVALLCGLTPFAFLPFPYLALRSKLSLDLLSHAYLITLYLIVSLTAAALGGAVSTTSFFLMLLPLLATLLFGIHVGMIWVAIVGATFMGLHVAREFLPPSSYVSFGAPPADWLRMQDVSFWNAAMMTLLALAAASSVSNFRAIVGQSSALLDEAAVQTRDARVAQQAAEELARSKSEFMANVSHELRTPLNAIIGYSELLIESAQERGLVEESEDNRRVLEAALKLRGMISDVLKLAAVEAGKLKIEHEEVHAHEIVLESVEAIETLLQSRGASVHVTDDTGSGAWLTDAEKLGACIRNLLTNAAQCCANGRIDVRIAAAGGELPRLIVEVRDDGPPVAPDRVECLFEPFAQPEMTGPRHYEGMGLTLALTRRLARLLGGDLTISPTTNGARFRLEVAARFTPEAVTRRAS